MDARLRLRSLFSRKTSETHRDGQRIKAQSYESTVASQPPVKGSRPIAGNGPYHLENTGLLSQGLGAEAPDVPRERKHSFAGRPLTAPARESQPAQFDSYRRTRSGFSSGAPSFSRASHPRHGTGQATPRVRTVRSISAFNSASHRSRKNFAHIDILDAASQIKPSHRTHVQRVIASGIRDYGEDVADRNIAEYGGIEFEPAYDDHDATPSNDSGDDALEEFNELVEPLNRKESDARNGSIRKHAPRADNDGVNEDTIPLNQKFKYIDSQMYSQTGHGPINHTPPPSLNTHSRHNSGNSESYSNSMRGRSRSSASTDVAPADVPPSHSNVVKPPSIVTSGVSIRPSSSNKPVPSASTRNQPILKPTDSSREPLFPPHPVVAPAIVSNRRGSQESQSRAYNPAPIPTSRFSRHAMLPTPPMSPSYAGSPTTSIPRTSLDKGRPATRGHSRSGSASYSVFLPEGHGRNTKARSRAATISSDNSDATVRPNGNRRADQAFEGSPEEPSSEAIVDMDDADVIKTQPEGVVHEDAALEVNHTKGEPITRETRNHNVHQIEPAVDLDSLPTKQHVRVPSGAGLTGISESALNGPHTKRVVEPVGTDIKSLASAASWSNIQTITAKHPENISRRDPDVQNRPRTVSNGGLAKEDTVRRQLEKGGREAAKIASASTGHDDDDTTDDGWDERWAAASEQSSPSDQASTNADGEEELLFRDSDFAFDGCLPGLEDLNPAVTAADPDPAVDLPEPKLKVDPPGRGGAGQAILALRRRQAEVTRKMRMLRVAETDSQ